MMDEKILQEKFSDEKFLATLKKCSTAEDAAKLFSENGIEIDAKALTGVLTTIRAVESGELVLSPEVDNDLEEGELSDDLAERVAGGNDDMAQAFTPLIQMFSVMMNNPMCLSILIENMFGEEAAPAAQNLRKVSFIMEQAGFPLARQNMQMAQYTMEWLQQQEG